MCSCADYGQTFSNTKPVQQAQEVRTYAREADSDETFAIADSEYHCHATISSEPNTKTHSQCCRRFLSLSLSLSASGSVALDNHGVRSTVYVMLYRSWVVCVRRADVMYILLADVLSLSFTAWGLRAPGL